jgi:hypothetical protein
MTLLRIVDAYGKAHYFNPHLIAQIEETGSDRCRIRFEAEMSIDVKQSADNVYGLIMSECVER